MNFYTRFTFLLAFILLPFSLLGQNTSESLSINKPNLFLDCNRCFDNYLKENIRLINFVRDKNDAQIHLLITRAQTGSGGTEYTMSFIGQEDFDETRNTLVYVSPQSDTDEDERIGLARYIKIGLTPFLAKTALIDYLGINFREIGEDDRQPTNKWNKWVFEIDASTSLSGEEQRSSVEFDGGVEARRITNAWKIELEADANYERDKFELDEGDDFTSIERRNSFETLVVKSLSDHWSAGFSSRVSTSTFRNVEFQAGASPAVEYNIYPYAEYNEHELSFLYKVAPTYFAYEDTTIFNKKEEFLVEQSMEVTYEVTQTWGSVRSTLEGSNFLHDFSTNRLDFRGRLDVRIFRGFSINMFGNYSLINDQIALPAEGVTDEEALLRLRQRATGFEFNVGVGLSYSFGSIYNNIVNPRF
jgi:hypothetical protein